MSTIYLCILVFLLCLAVFDLFVGVSNDAVNFLQSAVGAKVAKFRTILIVASFGVLIGAVMSSGMMDVARHGILMPNHYSFNEVMTIFLAVMVTDVIVLDVFNSLGMPTSTTVSLVFELLGGTFALAVVKMAHDGNLAFSDLLNTEQAMKVIIAIFISVAIAFFFGIIVQWISRLVFTFNYKSHMRYAIAIFGGIAFTSLAYFIFMKGLGKSPYIPESASTWITENTRMLLVYTFIFSTLMMEVMYLLRVNIFKFVVLMGTFALAMAFAGNDLVNFIGVPLAGLDSYQDFMANAHGTGASSFLMTSLMESAKTPPVYLLLAGLVMIIAMAISKKAQNVIKTSVDLSRQDEGEEMFGSSRAARAIVRATQDASDKMSGSASRFGFLNRIRQWAESRFDKQDVALNDGAAFDVVRAAVNLVLASMLITIGTNYKLPLSTTYVTFMVAMGSSLADRAWSRESAVFRVTGVISVIGGWFITAGVAFTACALVCVAMYYGGIIVQVGFMALVVYMLISSNRRFTQKKKKEEKDDAFRLMMRTRDPEIVWDLLRKQVRTTQSLMAQSALDEYNQIVEGLADNKPSILRHALRDLRGEKDVLKKYRRQQLLALRRVPMEIAVERNTWFHVGLNACQQYTYCLLRMLEPIKEHVDNNFTPLPEELKEEYKPLMIHINGLFSETISQISTSRFGNYRETLEEADRLKDELSQVRKRQIDKIQQIRNEGQLQISLVYLNLLQESQQFLSNMRHQLRAAKKFMEN
ncbi:MAG: inorganic phosphate transporter [Prevotella sp.]|jgi:phosphate/sulfate permease|nr:inorganic phosphate transporter [Prevotella sp.]MCI1282540.1 inorganic phosphate transporter [Prevotella sp.]